MKRRLSFAVAVVLGLIFLSTVPAAVSHAQSIEAAEIISFTCEGFRIGTRSDPGTIDFKFQLRRTNPPGPVEFVSGSFQQTTDPQITPFPWSAFPNNTYVLPDGTLSGGDYEIVNSPQDDPVGRTATLTGFNTIPLHYSTGPIFCEGEPCLLEVEKYCSEPPPTSGLECTDSIVATLLRYIGPDIQNATVEFDPSERGVPKVVYNNVDLISGVTILSMPAENNFTIDARPETAKLGSKVKIKIDGIEELIHTSCSTPYVAGQPAPLDNPKGDPSPNWFVENFVDKDSDTIVAVPGPPDLAEECEVEGVKPGSCADGKPTALVFEYTGEGCVDGNDQPTDKWSCSGDPNFAAPVEVVMTKDAGIFTVTPSGESIGLNQTFEIRRTDELGKEFPSEIKFDIRQGSQTLQSLKMHTSCSQPLEVGDQFGSVILKQFVPKGSTSPSANVVYTYRVTNAGPTDVAVDVDDSQFGLIADDLSIPAGGTVELTETALLSEPGSVTNVVTVTDTTDPDCFATDEVTVEVVEPPEACIQGKTKVAAIIFEYTGADCSASSTNQPSDKWACAGTPGADPVSIIIIKDPNKITVNPSAVSVGDPLTISAIGSEVGSEIQLQVGGQFLKFHTSCSQPLAEGDQFGSLLVKDLVLIPN